MKSVRPKDMTDADIDQILASFGDSAVNNLYQDILDPPLTEAGRWLALLWDHYSERPLVEEPGAMALLEREAMNVEHTGYCQRMVWFADGSQLLLGRKVERVL